MKKYVNGKYIDLTQEEIAQAEHESKKFMAQEKHRKFTIDEVLNISLKAQVNTLDVADDVALKMIDYYPTFEESVGKEVAQGYKFTYQGKLYKVIQTTLTIQTHYPPTTGTESLYEIINEQYDGDIYDPIPYESNMALENGKYYTQDRETYVCTRNTEIAVYNALSDLVGIYVEVVTETE